MGYQYKKAIQSRKTNNQPFIKEEPIIDPSTSQETVSRHSSGVSQGSFQEEEKESGNRKFAQRRTRVNTEKEKVLKQMKLDLYKEDIVMRRNLKSFRFLRSWDLR